MLLKVLGLIGTLILWACISFAAYLNLYLIYVLIFNSIGSNYSSDGDYLRGQGGEALILVCNK